MWIRQRFCGSVQDTTHVRRLWPSPAAKGFRDITADELYKFTFTYLKRKQLDEFKCTVLKTTGNLGTSSADRYATSSQHLISCMALTGIPFIAGYYSKHAIIE